MRSPKTAGHDGHAVRVVPIAPELRPILQDLFDAAEPGTEAVVPRLGGSAGSSANLRTTFSKIIAKAGESPWPRLFHNMRASCATDWVERFPGHVVAGWLGHSPLIAARHYLQTRDAHFDLATGATGAALESGAKCGAPEAQNAAQHPTAPDCTGSAESSESPCFAGVSRPDANECDAATGDGNGRGRIRTCVGIIQQIYSLPPLATWVHALPGCHRLCRDVSPHPVTSRQRYSALFREASTTLRRSGPVLSHRVAIATNTDPRTAPVLEYRTAAARIRTGDLRFTKPSLYQLSYGGNWS